MAVNREQFQRTGSRAHHLALALSLGTGKVQLLYEELRETFCRRVSAVNRLQSNGPPEIAPEMRTWKLYPARRCGRSDSKGHMVEEDRSVNSLPQVKSIRPEEWQAKAPVTGNTYEDVCTSQKDSQRALRSAHKAVLGHGERSMPIRGHTTKMS
jgi:hypothetical protein